ncbi:Z-ring formation inhibitor MciZ [Microaerobacter geothermalis]|uniref:Z-ring formation inhibitor MciZ n=1 Tax=Microaerobacter geothermalis TaxID=674972 RepID=UPI0038B2D3E0
MKVYIGSKELRIVGKCWEIKNKLKTLSNDSLTLHQYLKTTVNDCINSTPLWPK